MQFLAILSNMITFPFSSIKFSAFPSSIITEQRSSCFPCSNNSRLTGQLGPIIIRFGAMLLVFKIGWKLPFISFWALTANILALLKASPSSLTGMSPGFGSRWTTRALNSRFWAAQNPPIVIVPFPGESIPANPPLFRIYGLMVSADSARLFGKQAAMMFLSPNLILSLILNNKGLAIR